MKETLTTAQDSKNRRNKLSFGRRALVVGTTVTALVGASASIAYHEGSSKTNQKVRSAQAEDRATARKGLNEAIPLAYSSGYHAGQVNKQTGTIDPNGPGGAKGHFEYDPVIDGPLSPEVSKALADNGIHPGRIPSGETEPSETPSPVSTTSQPR